MMNRLLLRPLERSCTFFLFYVIFLAKPLLLFRVQVLIYRHTHGVRRWSFIELVVRYYIFKVLLLRVLLAVPLVPSVRVVGIRNCLELLGFSKVGICVIRFLRLYIIVVRCYRLIKVLCFWLLYLLGLGNLRLHFDRLFCRAFWKVWAWQIHRKVNITEASLTSTKIIDMLGLIKHLGVNLLSYRIIIRKYSLILFTQGQVVLVSILLQLTFLSVSFHFLLLLVNSWISRLLSLICSLLSLFFKSPLLFWVQIKDFKCLIH